MTSKVNNEKKAVNGDVRVLEFNHECFDLQPYSVQLELASSHKHELFVFQLYIKSVRDVNQ